jgi:hypothetical protein
MSVDSENAKISEIVVPRGRQSQLTADPVTRLVRSGNHTERKREVGGGYKPNSSLFKRA